MLFVYRHEDDHRRRPAAEQCVCGPEPSRRAARITAASPERRSRGACSASVTAAGAAQAACSRRRGRGCWPTPTVRQATASIKCFEQNFEMSRLSSVSTTIVAEGSSVSLARGLGIWAIKAYVFS